MQCPQPAAHKYAVLGCGDKYLVNANPLLPPIPLQNSPPPPIKKSFKVFFPPGKNRGLTLIIDAHSDILSPRFGKIFYSDQLNTTFDHGFWSFLWCYILKTPIFCSTVQDDFEGFMSIVNSRSMFPSLFEKVITVSPISIATPIPLSPKHQHQRHQHYRQRHHRHDPYSGFCCEARPWELGCHGSNFYKSRSWYHRSVILISIYKNK